MKSLTIKALVLTTLIGTGLTLGIAAQAANYDQAKAKARDAAQQAKSAKTAVDLACTSTAVEKRENTIITAEATLHTSWSTALTTRRDALKTAWAITDRTERRQAIKDAWTAYKKSRKAAFATWRESRNGSWKTWNTERKACGASEGDDKTTKGIDVVSEPSNQ